MLGIGIDEDTAIRVYPDAHFEVLGSNAVTVIDGSTIKAPMCLSSILMRYWQSPE